MYVCRTGENNFMLTLESRSIKKVSEKNIFFLFFFLANVLLSFKIKYLYYFLPDRKKGRNTIMKSKRVDEKEFKIQSMFIYEWML